ncbi:MAG TPA: tetratricopeptide repeat protein [Chryseosolibacter sp.]
MRLLLVITACFCLTISLYSQKLPLINSGQVIQDANVAYDSGDYSAAIKALQTIHKADTNYVFMLSELAEAYYANEQFDSALQVAKTGLAKPSPYRQVFLKVEALATDKKGEREKAISLLNKAIAEYPTSTTFMFFLASNYQANKEYEKAVECYFKVLSINPFHAASHSNLGRIAIVQGRKVHAMLSLGIYLSVNTTDNNTLVLLDNLLDNEVTDEATVTPFGTNSADKLDRIIKAKIAMEKDFKSAIPITAAVVRQFELLFDQIGTLPTDTDDRWLKFYLPSFVAIQQSQTVEPFIYHILTSSSIESAQKWRTKNEKELKRFFGIVNQQLVKHRQQQIAPAFGFHQPIPAWYSNNVVEALGVEDGELRQGPWVYLHPNQQKKAEGSYDKQGKKIGVWRYYHTDGQLKSQENYETGNATVFFGGKSPKEEFILRNDKIDGEVTLYYECGAVREKLDYKDGQRSGKGESYYTSGKIMNTYSHENDLLQGPYRSYFQNGKAEGEWNYDKGKLHGSHKRYYANGKLSAEGEYANGEAVGKWTYYHDNGKISRTGSYSEKGIPQGEWSYFNEKGQVTEKRNFNPKGERNGENSFYYDGSLWYAFTFKNGLLTQCIYYDKSGKPTGKFGSNNGDFAVKHFYNTGQLSGEGAYKKGEAEGAWKYYDRYGNVASEYVYSGGKLNGPAVTYFPTGEKKIVCAYVADELHGYYVEYYRSGSIVQEGWYQNGNREQRWLTYYSDGRIESDYYFLRDDLTGSGTLYGVDGKIVNRYDYERENITGIHLFGPDGKDRTITTPTKFGFTANTIFANKKIRMKNEIACGALSNEFLAQTPDGKTYIRYSFVSGKRDGAYEYNHVNGAKDVVGQYEAGNRSGIWRRFFDNGSLYYEGRYKDDKQDSIWNYYFENGNISSMSTFENGNRQGVSKYYSPEGVLLLEKLFVDDDLVAYRTVGSGATEWTTFTGDAKIVIKNPAGTTLLEQEYKKGERDGHFKLYYSNGAIYEIEEYKKGERVKEYTIYHPNGKISERGAYENDNLEGKVEYFNPDGSIRKSEHYLHGALHGKQVLYTAGRPSKEFTFWNGYIE